MTRLTRSLIVLVTCSALSTSAATAQPLFFEDFEGGDLSQWVGKGGGGHNAEIVPDPVRLDNQVLNFTALNAAGDIFGFLKTVTFGLSYILEFEYLGVLEPGGVPDDLGGTIRFSDGTPGGHRWLAGTRLCCFIENALLVDDGQWRTHTIEFDPFRDFFPVNNRIRVMVEDFFESGGIAGDAFFDNIRLREAVREVDIDIKPGSFPNSINPSSRGGTPVAILGSASLMVSDIDVDTLTLETAEVKTVGKTARSLCRVADVSGNFSVGPEGAPDGYADLVCHFATASIALERGTTEATVKGTFAAWAGGGRFAGTDSVNIVPRPGRGRK